MWLVPEEVLARSLHLLTQSLDHRHHYLTPKVATYVTWPPISLPRSTEYKTLAWRIHEDVFSDGVHGLHTEESFGKGEGTCGYPWSWCVVLGMPWHDILARTHGIGVPTTLVGVEEESIGGDILRTHQEPSHGNTDYGKLMTKVEHFSLSFPWWSINFPWWFSWD